MSGTLIFPVRYTYDPQPLRDACEQQKVSQRQLAAEKGCHYVTICRVLKGRAASPEIVEWLCHRLKVPQEQVIPSRGQDAEKILPRN